MKSNLLHTASNNVARNFLKGISWIACAFVLSLVTAPVGAAQNRLVRTAVSGLPGGLSVGFVARVTQCTANGIQFPLAGSTNLTEETQTTIERVTGPGGQVTFVAVTRSTYVGELTVALPANNGCNGVPNDTVVFDHSVLAQDNGNPVFRFANIGMRVTSSPFQLNRTLEGKTSSIVENGLTPTNVTKNVFHRMSVAYADSFGTNSISTPSLEFTQPGTGPGGIPTIISRAKMFLTDTNNACLRVNGITQCRALSQGGTLTNGTVTLNVGAITDSTNSTTRFVSFSFRLEPGFATGSFSLVGAADDEDTDEYMVNGEPEVLNLLPWKALKLAVDVVN